MRFATEGPISFQVAIRVAILLVCGYGVVQLTLRLNEGPGQAATAGPPTPQPEAIDPLNPGIWIEGGTFVSGSDDWDKAVASGSPFSQDDEEPRQRTVAGFWMQKHEVTNGEYQRFDAEHEFSSGQERHPVVSVTWREALAYAISLGGSLPTEWQWEFAARGYERRTYPWGNSEPTCERSHFAPCDPRGPTEVMARPDGGTPQGIHDMAGNVLEWVMPMWFVPGRTPVNHQSRRLRGGSFADEAFFLRAAKRTMNFRSGHEWNDIGFRVVWPAS
jgi:formylglycine-generating enzyme required for sulfatase activity